MKKTLLAMLAALCVCASPGCCRCWFKWPGHYEHNPTFSQCCDRGHRDPFGNGHVRRARLWGGGATPDGSDGGQCQYNCRLSSLLPFFGRGHGGTCGHDRCGCEGRGHGFHGGGHGFHGGPAGYGSMQYPGMYGPGGPGMPGMAYGPGGPGGPGMIPVSPEGIPLQPAPDAMSAAQVVYPYYTNRGPRDFLMGYPPGTVPPSIGP